MLEALKLASLKATCGQQIFCNCESILDCRRAVEVTVVRHGRPVFCRAFCGKCADTQLAGTDEACQNIARALTARGLNTAPEDLEVQVVDGRQHSEEFWKLSDAVCV